MRSRARLVAALLFSTISAAVTADTQSISASFACDGGKKIQATFATGPQPSVTLILSDGRHLVLPQAVSASGARYANRDDSFVFWNKGRTAFIEEAGKRTYTGCAQSKYRVEPRSTMPSSVSVPDLTRCRTPSNAWASGSRVSLRASTQSPRSRSRLLVPATRSRYRAHADQWSTSAAPSAGGIFILRRNVAASPSGGLSLQRTLR
jgi:membrane-bound inhibitor of C-type lysozyme